MLQVPCVKLPGGLSERLRRSGRQDKRISLRLRTAASGAGVSPAIPGASPPKENSAGATPDRIQISVADNGAGTGMIPTARTCRPPSPFAIWPWRAADNAARAAALKRFLRLTGGLADPACPFTLPHLCARA